MDIACPACATRYVVPDTAIGADGRVLRCAKCRHSWFQERADVPDAPAEAASEQAIAEAPIAVSPPAYAPATYAEPSPTRSFAETPSSFVHEPPFRPRRNPVTFWIFALILFMLVAVGAAAAMANFGVPDWLPLPHDSFSFAQAQPDLKLNFPPNQQQWRPLPNGNTFFNVSGSITNAGSDRRAVPTLAIVLRDAHSAVVYSLETAAPKSVLGPGESETVDQAIIDAPKSASTAMISWKTH